ncbi:MAG: adenylate/guanylate cyclase domain-containing protein [Acidimicrobiia bacterium]|nr:adenylate/guanylate cyclase domain-containing protein [Acidimicrobiia bacterium]
MARITAAERAALPDRAFADVDGRGRRRLPIMDAAHVRNALARFNQVEFDDDRARDAARARLLRAARKYRIVPVGFIDSQLRTARGAPRRVDTPAPLPSGFVTMLMTDIEGSTALLDQLGDDYGDLLSDVRRIQRAAVQDFDGTVVEARADDVFAAFASPRCAVEAAIGVHQRLAAMSRPGDLDVRVRCGLHAGYPTLRDETYIGMAVHTTARVADAAHGGQLVISGDTKMALTDMIPEGVRFRSLGTFRLRGIPDEHALYQVLAEGLATRFPPLRISP